MKEKLQLLLDRIAVRKIYADEKTAGGILVPEKAAEKWIRGEVVFVGKGRRNGAEAVVPMNVKVGDKVLLDRATGESLKWNGEELWLMYEAELVGIIK